MTSESRQSSVGPWDEWQATPEGKLDVRALFDRMGDDTPLTYAARCEAEVKRLRKAVALHARTLDDRALGHPEHVKRDRDSIDNELYNAVRAADPAWWDREVPGLNGDTSDAERTRA